MNSCPGSILPRDAERIVACVLPRRAETTGRACAASAWTGPRTRVAAALAVALGLASHAAIAQDAPAAEPLTLKPATELAPPAPPKSGGSTAATPGTAAGTRSRPRGPQPALGTPGSLPAAAPGAPEQPAAPTTGESGAVFLRADRMEGDQSRVEASGKVELRTQHETVLADRLTYDVVTGEIEGKGNVVLRRGSDSMTGPEMKFRRDDRTGFFIEPKFQAGELGGRGDATKITFLGEDRYEVENGRYTTCAAPRQDWFLETRDMELDNDRKVGVAHDATLSFFGTPILYTPWVEFPLSNQRKSGFLTPTAGSSGNRGFEFALPYYWNLAPNYDATLTPRLMTKRGVQLNGQFRYLGNDPSPMAGETDLAVLPDDRVTNTTRWLVATRHSQQIAPGLAGYWNVNAVSDDTYFADLADRVQVTSQTTLPREGGLTYNRGPWALLARVQNFQTLQDPTQPITPPYNRLPQVNATLAETEALGLTWQGMADYSNFRQTQLPQGERGVLYPQVAWIRQTPGWFLIARGSVHLRQYNLLDPAPGIDPNPSFAIPIASIDGGMTFERDTTLFDRKFIQTLEPRAFYVYIPYRNQSNIPAFDTALDDFNFSQLFTENRYVGNDLIGDANQLTVALTTRLLDPGTGVERLRAAVGQRFYFATQQVTLPGEVPRSASSSDLLFGIEGRITDQWSLNGLLDQNLDTGATERFNAGVRWVPGAGKALAATWRYTAQNADPAGTTIKQFDLAGQWPIDARWTALGRWNYSLVANKTLEAVAGVEYNADCWTLRLVYHRLATTTQQTTNSVYLQLELSGIARLGTSPIDLLYRSIPGYNATLAPSRTAFPISPYPEF
jgi:LPS-assembly protein